MALYIDNISGFEAAQIIQMIKDKYPKAKMQFIDRSGKVEAVK